MAPSCCGPTLTISQVEADTSERDGAIPLTPNEELAESWLIEPYIYQRGFLSNIMNIVVNLTIRFSDTIQACEIC